MAEVRRPAAAGRLAVSVLAVASTLGGAFAMVARDAPKEDASQAAPPLAPLPTLVPPAGPARPASVRPASPDPGAPAVAAPRPRRPAPLATTRSSR
jgi:hypothetical protein